MSNISMNFSGYKPNSELQSISAVPEILNKTMNISFQVRNLFRKNKKNCQFWLVFLYINQSVIKMNR